jgi:hypothetical protein
MNSHQPKARFILFCLLLLTFPAQDAWSLHSFHGEKYNGIHFIKLILQCILFFSLTCVQYSVL